MQNTNSLYAKGATYIMNMLLILKEKIQKREEKKINQKINSI